MRPARKRRLSCLQGILPAESLFRGQALLALWSEAASGQRSRPIVELVASMSILPARGPMIAAGGDKLLERGMASWKRMLRVMETVPTYA